MAANMTAMQVEGTTVSGATQKHRGAQGRRMALIGLVTTILFALLIAGAVLHTRGASQPTASAIPSVVTNTHQLTVVPVCTGLDDSGYTPTCYTPQADGTWQVTQKDWEGIWQRVGTVTSLPQGGAGAPYMEDFTPRYGQDR